MTGCQRLRIVFRICCLLVSGVCGCGGNPTPPAEPPSVDTEASPSDIAPVVSAPAEPVAASDNLPTTAADASTPTRRRPDEVWEDESGRRYLGDVPYDVFFDQPLAVASEGQDVTAVTAEIPRAMPNDPAESAEGSDAAEGSAEDTAAVSGSDASGSDWPSLLPAAALEAEVKSIRNFLNQKLRSVGTYNSSMTMIPAKAATLAALAAIADQHAGRISWKTDAGYVRDLAASMNDGVLQRGPRDQRRLLSIYENLADTLNRSRPSGLEPPAESVGFSDVAEMRLLMMRMEQAEQQLRTEVSENSFGSQSEMVIRESSILSALMQLMTTESYGYADDPDFADHAQKIIEAGRSMKSAADAGDYAAFELSLSQLAGTCQACHRDYKNN